MARADSKGVNYVLGGCYTSIHRRRNISYEREDEMVGARSKYKIEAEFM